MRPEPEWQIGRMSRAMVFASAALTASACGGNKQKTSDPDDEQRQMQRVQNHPCSDPDPKEIARLEKERDEATDLGEKQRLEKELAKARTPNCAPYGAPPARRRIV